jgi:hypothetical protein
MDPRAAVNPLASARGGVNILTLFAEENKTPSGEIVGPRMTVLPSYSGRGIDDGITHVNDLLSYNAQEPVCRIINEPRLYVANRCRNMIWMFENYTNQGGEESGCKDPADLVRYMAQDDDLRHIGETGFVRTTGFVEGF